MSARSIWLRLLERFSEDSLRPNSDLFHRFDDPVVAARVARLIQEARSDLFLRPDSTRVPGAVTMPGLGHPEAGYLASGVNTQPPIVDRVALYSNVIVIVGRIEDTVFAARLTNSEPPEPADLVGGPGDRTAVLHYGSQLPIQSSGNRAAPFDGSDMANYVVIYSDNLQDALVYDANTRTLLTGGPGDWPALSDGPDDTLELSGDFSDGYALPPQSGIETVVLRPGYDYNLYTTDDNVDAGDTLYVDAMPLGDDNHVMFDGSAETDGRFEFFGGGADDFFFGGAGDDRIIGHGGGDSLTGGGGSDIFVYANALDSTGVNYDTIADFDPSADRIDLPGTVAGFGTAIEGGRLSLDSFNADLAAAVGDLGASQAVWFAPDRGDLAGQIFLVIDGNGQPGYQEGEDFVIAIAGTPLADLTGHTDIFI